LLGTYYFPNNDRYEGEFVDNLKHGKGTYTYFDGKVKVGEWKDDKQVIGKEKDEN
jgi:hypothetical protein